MIRRKDPDMTNVDRAGLAQCIAEDAHERHLTREQMLRKHPAADAATKAAASAIFEGDVEPGAEALSFIMGFCAYPDY